MKDDDAADGENDIDGASEAIDELLRDSIETSSSGMPGFDIVDALQCKVPSEPSASRPPGLLTSFRTRDRRLAALSCQSVSCQQEGVEKRTAANDKIKIEHCVCRENRPLSSDMRRRRREEMA